MDADAVLNKHACGEFMMQGAETYVPKCIAITACNDASGSAILANPFGQSLFKLKHEPDCSIEMFCESSNNGMNYCLRKVEAPEPDKLYFATDRDDFSEVGNIECYRIILPNRVHCSWARQPNGCYRLKKERLEMKNYYEVMRKKETIIEVRLFRKVGYF